MIHGISKMKPAAPANRLRAGLAGAAARLRNDCTTAATGMGAQW
jgi:hypothetical protein